MNTVGIKPVLWRDNSQTDTFVRLVLAALGFVLKAFNATGRTSTSVDQMFDSHLGSMATRVNKARAAKAVATGKSQFVKVTRYDILRGIYHSDPEIAAELKYNSADLVNFANKVAKKVGYDSYVGEGDATALLEAVAKAYCEDAKEAGAQAYICLDDLSPKQLAETDKVEENIASEILEEVISNTKTSAPASA